MKSDLNKWQGIEQEFRIGISLVSERYKPAEYAIMAFNALKGYKFFDFSNLGEHDLYERVADVIGVERILREEDIGEALLYPPENSRASLRTALIAEIMRVQPENIIVRWNRIVNPPTADAEINFDELDGWDEERIKEKMEEARRFCGNRCIA